jgi:hypothetical protein
MHGGLNSFQKTMLQWNDLHPYNAVHVVRLTGIPDQEQLRLGLGSTLERRGLTNLFLNRAKNTYAYLGGPMDCDLKVLTGEANPIAALQAEVEQQINTPFAPAERINPFRFFAVVANDGFFLGLAYFHPVADAESVVLLLRDVARACLKKTEPESFSRLDLYPDHRARLLRRHPAVVARKLLAFPREIGNLRRSHRPHYRDAKDSRNAFTLFSLRSEQLRSLLAAAKTYDMTVNDLLLALLMKSVSPLSARRVKAAKRNKLSVGCIVNLRRELAIDSARTFGLFLGSFTITHRVQEGITLRELAGEVRRQTAVVKQRRLFLATPMELGLGRFILRFFSPERRRKFYQKNYPLCGGLTNMNLNSLWGQSDDDGPVDYFRGVSTGPVTPLVFSVTTVGDRANVGVSYRSTVFSATDIESVKNNFVKHLEELREGA